MMTLTIVRLLDSSVEALARELDRRAERAPALFKDLPIILDVGAVASSDLHLDLPGFVALLRARGLVPLGIRGGDERWIEAAETVGLSMLAPERIPAARAKMLADADAEGATAPVAAEDVGQAAGRSMIVTKPVRSGQQIYARGTDLVILSPVSHGAEVLADGHVHVYSTLNGRALAGVRGDVNARIFCKSFRAELVSVAGVYSVSEQFHESLAGQPVQVSLNGDTLQFERL